MTSGAAGQNPVIDLQWLADQCGQKSDAEANEIESPGKMKKHFDITVCGKVQGVFFRASAKQMADALGIAGFVRNEHDGNVYLEAEGDENTLDEFVQWCHEGPARAHVSGCHVSDGPLKSFSTFQIER